MFVSCMILKSHSNYYWFFVYPLIIYLIPIAEYKNVIALCIWIDGAICLYFEIQQTHYWLNSTPTIHYALTFHFTNLSATLI